MWSGDLFVFIFLACVPRVLATMQNTIALVTGSNKGIGREIAHMLSSPPCSVTTILACRSENLGLIAANELKGLGCNVIFHQLGTSYDIIHHNINFYKKCKHINLSYVLYYRFD